VPRLFRREKMSIKRYVPEDTLDGSLLASHYDSKAEEYDWRGPEVVFGLSYSFVNPGESVLDIGIGTGLGSVLFHKAGLHVYGMDVSTEMLEACRSKGFAADLKKHDMTAEPYPYNEASLDHAVCLGVLNFFKDLQLFFRETARILRDRGIFVFVVGDHGPGEESEFVVGREHTQTDSSVTMYRHGIEEIKGLLNKNHFELVRCFEFSVPMDRERTETLRAKAYVVRRRRRI
jgi:predicted TPR repeat methyltransferase